MTIASADGYMAGQHEEIHCGGDDGSTNSDDEKLAEILAAEHSGFLRIE